LVERGLPLPYLSGDAIDTGFVYSDFLPEALTRLQYGSGWWHRGGRNRWGKEVADALPPSIERARLLLRLGDTGSARVLLTRLQGSQLPLDRVEAARALVALDPAD